MLLHQYGDKFPIIHPSVFLGAGIQLIGDIEVQEYASIWFNTVLRGDLAPIRIGARANIQDLCIGHVNTNQPLMIEDEVSIGHGAIIHGCRIGKGSLIGMGAILLNGADIGEYALIAAGSLVPENKIIPPYTLSMGTPAKVIRELTEDDLSRMKKTMESYVEKCLQYLNQYGKDKQ